MVNATIGAEDRAGASQRALAAREAGFGCVKLKVGVGDDAGRVAAVRAALGPDVQLRLDANGAWGVEEAVRAIECSPRPGSNSSRSRSRARGDARGARARRGARRDRRDGGRGGRAGIGRRGCGVPEARACGGISGLLASATLVRASGAEPYLASTFDGPLGIAAALHAAAALRLSPACGLATLKHFEDAAEHAFCARGGMIDVPRGPGLMEGA